MRIVFFGTSAFAVPTLRAVAAEHEILLVLTQPDRPSGRGHKLQGTPVKTAALELGLPVHAPLSLREESTALQALSADAFIVVSYGRILPQMLLDLPRFGAFNIHPSALPLYRGATPISAPIRDGRRETAVSIMLMDAGMDTGDIVLQEWTPIGETETGTQLHDRLASWSAQLMLRVLCSASEERLTPRPQAQILPQAEILATLTRPLQTTDLLIDWRWPVARICRHVRAYADLPAARVEFGTERLKILACRPATLEETHLWTMSSVPQPPGTFLGASGTAALVTCGDGILGIERLVSPGRPVRSGADFARSHGLTGVS